MSTIQEQLKNLEKQKEELEKRIQEEKEEKKSKQRHSIEHLEELVKPLSEEMDMKGKILHYGNSTRIFENKPISIHTKEIQISDREQLQINNNIYHRYLLEAKRIKNGIMYKRKNPNIVLPKEIRDQLDELVILPRHPMNKELLTEEIYLTLIGILKKQDERIKTLENIILKNQILNQDV